MIRGFPVEKSRQKWNSRYKLGKLQNLGNAQDSEHLDDPDDPLIARGCDGSRCAFIPLAILRTPHGAIWQGSGQRISQATRRARVT